MKISSMIRKLKHTENKDLIRYGGILEHMDHNGFFGPYFETIEAEKFETIESMLLTLRDQINPPDGIQTGQVLRAAFIGFCARNGKKKSRS